MDDLVAWYRQQADRDGEALRFGAPGMPPPDHMFGSHLSVMTCLDAVRQLHREVEAKRRILDLYETVIDSDERAGLLTAIQYLAEVLDDRAGYREEWRP